MGFARAPCGRSRAHTNCGKGDIRIPAHRCLDNPAMSLTPGDFKAPMARISRPALHPAPTHTHAHIAKRESIGWAECRDASEAGEGGRDRPAADSPTVSPHRNRGYQFQMGFLPCRSCVGCDQAVRLPTHGSRAVRVAPVWGTHGRATPPPTGGAQADISSGFSMVIQMGNGEADRRGIQFARRSARDHPAHPGGIGYKKPTRSTCKEYGGSQAAPYKRSGVSTCPSDTPPRRSVLLPRSSTGGLSRADKPARYNMAATDSGANDGKAGPAGWGAAAAMSAIGITSRGRDDENSVDTLGVYGTSAAPMLY